MDETITTSKESNIWTGQLFHQRKAISFETSTHIIISKKSGPNDNYVDQIKGILE
jgi:hypothetical protein